MCPGNLGTNTAYVYALCHIPQTPQTPMVNQIHYNRALLFSQSTLQLQLQILCKGVNTAFFFSQSILWLQLQILCKGVNTAFFFSQITLWWQLQIEEASNRNNDTPNRDVGLLAQRTLPHYLIMLNHYRCPIPVKGGHYFDRIFSFGKCNCQKLSISPRL